MKKGIFFVFFAAAAFLTAGECKYCGSKTDDCAVYRCNKCRTFFCAYCREGEKVQRSGSMLQDVLNYDRLNLKECTSGIVIICPECGAEDRLTSSGMRENNIRLVKERRP